MTPTIVNSFIHTPDCEGNAIFPPKIIGMTGRTGKFFGYKVGICREGTPMLRFVLPPDTSGHDIHENRMYP